MEYEIIIRPEAEKDLTEAFVWYEDKRDGLGFDFLLQVDAGLRFVARNPKIYAPAYKGTRKHIVIARAAAPRSGWAEAARKMRQRDEDKMLDSSTATRFDEEECRW